MERVCLSVAFMEETVRNGAVLVRLFYGKLYGDRKAAVLIIGSYTSLHAGCKQAVNGKSVAGGGCTGMNGIKSIKQAAHSNGI